MLFSRWSRVEAGVSDGCDFLSASLCAVQTVEPYFFEAGISDACDFSECEPVCAVHQRERYFLRPSLLMHAIPARFA